MPSTWVLRSATTLLLLLSPFLSLTGVSAGPLLQTAESSIASATSSSSLSASITTGATSRTSASAAQTTENLESSVSTSKPTAIRVTDTASSTEAGSTSSTTTALSAGEPKPTGGDFPVCHAATGPFRPFCLPNNGSEVWTGSTYYVTWDPDYFTINSSIRIELNYANQSGNGGDSAYTSPTVPNAYGYVTIDMQKDWLQGETRNNLTLYIVELDPTPDARASILGGPTLSLINKPVEHFKPPPHTKAPNHLGLILGLPIGLGFVALVVCGLCIGMRKHRKINVGNIMGKKGRGYGIGQSRIQRLGGTRKGKGAIRLGGMDRRAEPGIQGSQYMDDPRQGHVREDSLGSLVSDGYNDSERTRGNVFRNEVQRLKSWR